MGLVSKAERIAGVPAGPAALWLREKWVGLDLPVSPPRIVTRRAWSDFRQRGSLAELLALFGWQAASTTPGKATLST